jgi:hypothetical protein
MPYLILLILLVWATAIFVATVIYGFRSGEAQIIGPLLRVRRKDHPIGYLMAMACLVAPAAVGVVLSFAAASKVLPIVFPNSGVPAAPARGYAPTGIIVEDTGADSYFPRPLRSMAYRCRDYPSPVALLSNDEVNWYSKYLIAARELPLLSPLKQQPTYSNTYRFIWLRSFDKPIIIRINQIEDGNLMMTATQLSGKGGYEPGVIEKQIKRQLNTIEQRRFQAALASTKRLRLPAVTCNHGYDGAQWIVEGVDGGAYRYVNRWSPKSGPVRDLGLLLLGFSGFPLTPLY